MFKNKAGQYRSGWVILLAFFIMMVGQLIFMFPGLTMVSLLEMTQDGAYIEIDMLNMNHPWMILMTQGAGTFGGLAATFVVWRAINKRPVRELGIRGLDRDFWFGIFLGAISITFIFFILFITGNVSLENTVPQITLFTFSYLILFILVGYFEETFFRGYVMNIMASRGNKKWVIYVVSALLFSIVHGANPNVSFFGLVNILLVGILFAYMFDVTKSLMLPIGYHITWNFFQGNVFGFPVSGTPPNGMFAVDISGGNELLTGGSFGLEGGILATIAIGLGFAVTRFYARGSKKEIAPVGETDA